MTIPARNLLFRESRQLPGTRAALRWWRNAQGTGSPARGFVWILHGLGEHGGRYDELARFLTGFGFDVLAPDHPGHGLSAAEGGQRDLVSLDLMIEEAVDARRWWGEEGPLASRGARHSPWLLMGHSMGALLTLGWLVRGKRDDSEGDFALRAFASAPPLALRLPVPEWKKQAASLIGSRLPHLRMANGISSSDLSRDDVVAAAYEADPCVHGDASPELFLSMNALAARVVGYVADIEIPLMLAVGERDPIVDPAAVRAYYEQLGTHKRFAEFPGMKHEILNEIGRRNVYKALVEWLF